MEGLANLTVEQAFELTDASAERSAEAGVIALPKEQVSDTLRLTFLFEITCQRRLCSKCSGLANMAMQDWLMILFCWQPTGCGICRIIEINLSEIPEPLLPVPMTRTLSKHFHKPRPKIDEVFIGSCMIDLAHLEKLLR